MLIRCPECELQVSDKAISCPHCGYPLQKVNIKSVKKKSNKRRRLPNGFGQITELKGANLRKPFRAMVTIGKTDEGKPICKLLQPKAYFNTYNEAYEALLKYNKDPFSYANSITVEELYEKWTEKYFKSASISVKRRTEAAWKYCDAVKKLKVSEIRGRHIRYCMDEGFYALKNGEMHYPTPSAKIMIKTMFNYMLDYAVEYEMVDKNYSRMITISKEDKREIEENREGHIIYTDEEIDKLWKNINSNPIIDIILIQCYSGWRPKELELLKLENINLKTGLMKGGIKTQAGKDRIVPIHPKILDLVRNRYEDSLRKGSEYLFTMSGKAKDKNYPFEYYKYSRNLKLIIEQLNLNPNHRPHDGRAHFITLAKKYQMDEYAIKRIVGHEIDDVTEAIYTTRDVSWLKQEMEKIK